MDCLLHVVMVSMYIRITNCIQFGGQTPHCRYTRYLKPHFWLMNVARLCKLTLYHVQVYTTSCLLACSQLPGGVYNNSQKVCTQSLPSSHSSYSACAIHSFIYICELSMLWFPIFYSSVSCNMYTPISHSGGVILTQPKL